MAEFLQPGIRVELSCPREPRWADWADPSHRAVQPRWKEERERQAENQFHQFYDDSSKKQGLFTLTKKALISKQSSFLVLSPSQMVVKIVTW